MADFLKGVTNDLKKAGFDVGASEPPRYWFSTGNYVMNKILGGSYMCGIPQGRVTGLVGGSGTGKSFIACNIMREAQQAGAIVVVLDSEHALDDDFVKSIGVNPDSEEYIYIDIDTIPQCKRVVSKFTTDYKKQYGRDEEAPRIVVIIDSLGMLMTETESANYDKGVSKGDQGQRSKQIKAMLREFVQAIKHTNISIIITDGVYKNQDLLNGEGLYIVNDAEKFSLSHIALLSRLKLKDKNDKKNVLGMRMKVEGYKTRFTQPYQSVTIEVPYETGMDPYNGLIDVAKNIGILIQKGAYYYLEGQDKGWMMKDGWDIHKADILALCEAQCDKFLDAEVTDEDIEVNPGASRKSKRKDKGMPEDD